MVTCTSWQSTFNGNLPSLFDRPWVQVEPIESHADIFEISHLGKNLYNKKNLPERQPRDKFKLTYHENRFCANCDTGFDYCTYDNPTCNITTHPSQSPSWNIGGSRPPFLFRDGSYYKIYIVILRNINDRNLFCVRVSIVEFFHFCSYSYLFSCSFFL